MGFRFCLVWTMVLHPRIIPLPIKDILIYFIGSDNSEKSLYSGLFVRVRPSLTSCHIFRVWKGAWSGADKLRAQVINFEVLCKGEEENICRNEVLFSFDAAACCRVAHLINSQPIIKTRSLSFNLC